MAGAGVPLDASEQIVKMIESQQGTSAEAVSQMLGALITAAPTPQQLEAMALQRKMLGGDIAASMLPGSNILAAAGLTTVATTTWPCAIVASVVISIASFMSCKELTDKVPDAEPAMSYQPKACGTPITFVDAPHDPLCVAAKEKYIRDTLGISPVPSGSTTAPTSSTSTATPTSTTGTATPTPGTGTPNP